MTYKEIEKEFDKEFDFEYDATRTETAKWWLAKINQIIDEMVGEEKKKTGWIKMIFGDGSKMRRKILSDKDLGYNQKVQELKEFKKKFNE